MGFICVRLAWALDSTESGDRDVDVGGMEAENDCIFVSRPPGSVRTKVSTNKYMEWSPQWDRERTEECYTQTPPK